MPTTQALEHELRVHQIELERQNEELRRTQLDLTAARDRLADLYDYAPVGYFTLDRAGLIVEANLTGAAMLGVERQSLLRQPLACFIKRADRQRWHSHLLSVLRQVGDPPIELAVQPHVDALFQGLFDCRPIVLACAEPTLRVTLTDITARKQAEINWGIAAMATEARETERRHMSRELHEELGQRLITLKMELSGLCAAAADNPSQAQRLTDMLATLDEAIAMVRRMVIDLRPLMLDDLGLNAAIDWLARDSARRLGLDITLRLDDAEPPLDEHTSIAVYRLLQEMLAYIARHARTTDISIETLQQIRELILIVQTSGTGWPGYDRRSDDPDATATLHQQARLLGGELALDDSPGGGRRFTVRLPLPRTADIQSRRSAREPT